MKKTASILAVAVLAGASSLAQAADVSQSNPLALSNGTNYFGRVLDIGLNGDTFSDRWSFSTTAPLNFASGVIAVTPALADGIAITGFTLFNSAGLSLGGTQVSTGAADIWTIRTLAPLAADHYYLQVTGSVLSNASASYGGTVTLAPVPEPETYGMLLGGLGVLGFIARRRKRNG